MDHSSPANPSPVREPAAYWPRFLAYSVDSLVLQVLGLIVFFVFAADLREQFMNLTAPSEGGVPAISDAQVAALMKVLGKTTAVGSVLTILYYSVSHVLWGASPGKIMFKLRLINAHTGEKVYPIRTIVRIYASVLSGLILMIGYLMPLFRKDGKALHDVISGTQVIRAESAKSSERVDSETVTIA